MHGRDRRGSRGVLTLMEKQVVINLVRRYLLVVTGWFLQLVLPITVTMVLITARSGSMDGMDLLGFRGVQILMANHLLIT